MNAFSWRFDMTDEEAIELGQQAIYHATYRDAYSGGMNNGCVSSSFNSMHLVISISHVSHVYPRNIFMKFI